MNFLLPCFLCLSLYLPTFPHPQKAVEGKHAIELGGPRQAEAVLTVDKDRYHILVRMLPIQIFDSATNAHLNLEKGRHFAMQALAKHLSDDKEIHLTVSGGRVSATGKQDRFYTLAFEVPRQGVKLSKKEDKQPNGSKLEIAGDVPARGRFDSAFFTLKQDYQDLIDQLAMTLHADLKLAEQSAEKMKEVNFPAIAKKIKTRCDKDFEKLHAAIKGDSLQLFSGQLGELNRAIESRKNQVKKAVDQAVDRIKSRQTQEKSP